MPFKAGFSRVALAAEAGASAAPEAQALEVRCFAVETDDGPAVWLAFDLTSFFRNTNDFIRAAVADSLGVPATRVAVHCTHTHSVPDFFDAFPPALLAERACVAARAAVSAFQPFRFRAVSVDVGGRFSVRRRKCFPGIGAFTVWYGYRIRDGKADGSEALYDQARRIFGERLCEMPELERPLIFDGPVDPLVQMLVFENPAGAALGSILRFSAHPHTTSHTRRLRHHADFPGFARAAVERRLGGLCIYLSGPCGDISPLEALEFEYAPYVREPGAAPYYGPNSRVKAAREGEHIAAARRHGEALAAAALDAVASAAAEAPAVVRHATRPLVVPLRQDIIADADVRSALEARETAELEELRRTGAPLWLLRAKADRITQLQADRSWTAASVSEAEVRAGEAAVDMSALRLNGHAIAGLPSEPFAAASLHLRANTIGARLVVATLTNGWIGYVPTAEDVDMGGYESATTAIRRDGFQAYTTQACALIEELMR